jgi:signal transduction histidine kinase
LAKARKALVRDMVLLVLAAVMAVATAWFIGELTIMRRLGRLLLAANRLGTGDLGTRTGLDHGEGELGVLAAAFDRMAESLQIQDFDRRRAEHECCQLNTELEERVTTRTSELAKANKELQTALENLRQAQGQLVMSEKLAALGGLVAGVAHEINTPVGVALSATSTMAEKNRVLSDLFAAGEMKRSDLTEYLEASREGVEMSLLNLNRASDLIRSFKMVAADQVSESRRSFKVREYIGQVLLSLRPKLKKTPHRVEVECDEDLVVESYPGAFSQILTNFIVNSLTHAYDEGQAGLIRIEIVKNDGVLTLTYSDDGRGIAPEAQGRIFEPFYTTARARGSTGLGLHIVYNIVTVTLGGTVTCCSALGHGTTFQVRMPV